MNTVLKRGCVRLLFLAVILLVIGLATAVRVIGPLLNEGANVLILFNNTDERRGTGGFTTAYMTITRTNGAFVTHLGSSYEIDTPPTASGAVLVVPPPKPMHDTMGIDRWSFRDANWSPDVPTSAQAASKFYTLTTHAQTPLLVITVNMSALSTLMRHLPPMQACSSTTCHTLNQDTSLDWLRAAWTDSASGPQGDKSFIGDKARQLIAATRALPFSDQLSVIPALNDMLMRGDVLLYSPDAGLQAFFAARHWSGPFPFAPQGNTVLYSENNIGYNKTSSSLRREMAYSVDFTQSPPHAALTITYTSPPIDSSPIDPRLQTCHSIDSVGALALGVPTYEDRMLGCAWIYAMIYPMPRSKLTAYDIPPVAADQFPFGLRGQTGRIDAVKDGGVKGWGSVMVIPYGQSRTIKLTYTLPANTDETFNLPAVADMRAMWHVTIKHHDGRLQTFIYDTSSRTLSEEDNLTDSRP